MLKVMAQLQMLYSEWLDQDLVGWIQVNRLPQHLECSAPKTNVTPLIRKGNNLFFFAALYCSCLGFNTLLALPTKEGGNKGMKVS